jgi:hypothetical protein
MRDLNFILEFAESMGSLKPVGFDGDVDGYNDAIVGITDEGCLVYSKEKMTELCMLQGMEEEEALEWLSYNTFSAYVGDTTPIYINTGLVE